jgi:hypothetical protein
MSNLEFSQAHEVYRASADAGSAGPILIVANAAGANHVGYAKVADGFASRLQMDVAVIGFAGQGPLPGQFSVGGSCAGLAAYVRGMPVPPQLMVGNCTGALAMLSVVHELHLLTPSLCWELPSQYDYSVESHKAFETRSRVRVAWETPLREIQPIPLVRNTLAPVRLLFSAQPAGCPEADCWDGILKDRPDVGVHRIERATRRLGGTRTACDAILRHGVEMVSAVASCVRSASSPH